MYISLSSFYSPFSPEWNKSASFSSSKSDDLVAVLFERERESWRERKRARKFYISVLIFVKCAFEKKNFQTMSELKAKNTTPQRQHPPPETKRGQKILLTTRKRRTKTLSSSLVLSFTSLSVKISLSFSSVSFFVRSLFEEFWEKRDSLLCFFFPRGGAKNTTEEIQKTNVWKEEWSRRKSSDENDWTQSRTTKRSIKKEEA